MVLGMSEEEQERFSSHLILLIIHLFSEHLMIGRYKGLMYMQEITKHLPLTHQRYWELIGLL